ncbi:hypothetical protein [Gemmata obscuriglobus]|uniref:hypothetical protein n=1 Tax=Gemmata obscuriglobus TaxID=114 RepID=UPI0011CDF0B0|nr:hypothetical protein [Gemmata obscuriglobus]
MGERVAPEPDHAGLLRPFLSSRWRSRYDALRPGSTRRAELFNRLALRYAELLDWRYAAPRGARGVGKGVARAGGRRTCATACAAQTSWWVLSAYCALAAERRRPFQLVEVKERCGE